MGMDAGVGSEVEQRARPAPRMSRSACFLGQSRGRSLLHPRIMGQLLVSGLLQQATTVCLVLFLAAGSGSH